MARRQKSASDPQGNGNQYKNNCVSFPLRHNDILGGRGALKCILQGVEKQFEIVKETQNNRQETFIPKIGHERAEEGYEISAPKIRYRFVSTLFEKRGASVASLCFSLCIRFSKLESPSGSPLRE